MQSEPIYWWRGRKSQFEGLTAHTEPGVHEAVAALLSDNSVGAGRAVDLAAGTGSLIARLQFQGLGPFDAVERDTDRFGLKTQTPLALDLNHDFDARLKGDYHLVTACEIIEHLDNPRLFLERIHRLLQPAGSALISTPNIAFWTSRIRFLLTGVPRLFTPYDLVMQRHISPILDHHFRQMFGEVGFDLVAFRSVGSPWCTLIRWMVKPVELMFRLLGSSAVSGVSNIYLLRKRR